MDKQALLILLPNTFSITVSLVVFIYTRRRQQVSGADEFSWYVLATFLFTFFNSLELLSNTFETKLIWGNLRFVISLFISLAFLNFAVVFTKRKKVLAKKLWIVLIVVALFLVVLLYTDSYHHLFYPEGSITISSPYTNLNYEITPAGWSFIVYTYVLGLWGLLLLISSLFETRKQFRSQILAIIFSVILPIIGNVLSLSRVELLGHLDLTHILTAVGSSIIAFALFRYGLFDIVPVARDMLIEKMQDIVLVYDNQTRILDANPAALSFLDLDEQKIIGKAAVEVFPNWRNIEQQLNDSYGNSLELVIERDSVQNYLSVMITELLDDKGKSAGVLAIARNITEKKLAEIKINDYYEQLKSLNQELEFANEELHELDQLKDEFVANVSHELRSPMTNIRLFHEILQLQPERVSEFIDTLSRESERLADLIDSLLTLSHMDQGILVLEKMEFDLVKLVEEYVNDRDSLARKKDLTLDFSGDEKIMSVQADRKRIGQVFSILLTNSLNYTPGGGDVLVRVNNKTEGDEDWVGFCVQDTGLGISLEDQERIFERFYRGSSGYKSKVSGTGLGLAIAKEIVDLHGGKIILESTGVPGEGANFSVWLPQENTSTY